jgi:DNA-binding MarR family transcriptional regulator
MKPTKEKPPKVEPASLADPMATRLGYQLRRVSVLMMADLGASLAPTGLRPTEGTILLLIGANAGCRQGEVAQALGIKRANMVPLIAGLIRKGLVARARADGRSHALTLTPAGRAKTAAFSKLLDKQEAQFQSRLDQKSVAGLLAALASLRG